ncbi:MAG TPA: glucoamylase family protein [Steroidobacteraceae bacterium]|nr:glucoamylase family protein [Steroidobacteraceae bacterium]
MKERKPSPVDAARSPVDVAPSPADLAQLPDEELLEAVQRQTFGFFWEAAHPVSGLAPDRCTTRAVPTDDLVVTGGSGFGAMALIVAAERGWITRAAALERLGKMLDLLRRATCYHGAFAHFVNGRSGATIPFSRKDDGGDLVETAFLFMGLLCAREYFSRDTGEESKVRGLIDYLWNDVEWDWYANGREVLQWHWSPNNGWALGHEIRGWNECLVTYLLAASAPRYSIRPRVYHQGFAIGRHFLNGRSYCDIALPLGAPFGGPLFLSQYSFCGIDPRGLTDRYADYWQQNVSHARINHAHCTANPRHHKGYGESCWGLTSSDGPDGYAEHAPDNDDGTISPTAALSSMPYTPKESMQALRHFLAVHGDKIWNRFGFVDAFCESRDWYADTYIAIDQGPIVVMIENYRTGLLWKLFMNAPEIQSGLRALSFSR